MIACLLPCKYSLSSLFGFNAARSAIGVRLPRRMCNPRGFFSQHARGRARDGPWALDMLCKARALQAGRRMFRSEFLFFGVRLQRCNCYFSADFSETRAAWPATVHGLV